MINFFISYNSKVKIEFHLLRKVFKGIVLGQQKLLQISSKILLKFLKGKKFNFFNGIFF